jgi:hypothetical protein
MQKRMRKFIVLIFLSFFSFTPLFAQVSQYRLYTADSLFEAKRYTQALSKFEGVLKNGEYTPAMLLKMAYIHEGLGNIAKTQYFLNLYFISTNDASVLDKMSELADKNGLSGYEIDESDRLMIIIKQNAQYLIGLLAALLLLSLSWLLYANRTEKRPLAPFISTIACAIILFLSFYALQDEETCIVLQPNTYLMSGPSAGANLIEIIDAGHKLTITGKKDVWIKASWRDQDVYLKEEKLLPLTL